MSVFSLFPTVSSVLRYLCTALVFCSTLVHGSNLYTPEDSRDASTSIPGVVNHMLERPVTPVRITIIRCTAVQFFVHAPVLFTICALIMMRSVEGVAEDFPHFNPNPDFSTYRLGREQQKVEIDWHRQ